MVKVGVETDWEGVVSKGTSTVDSIEKVQNPKLSVTTLIPFTSFEELINKLNESLSNYQTFNNEDGKKMIQAGKNKEEDDTSGASSMKIVND